MRDAVVKRISVFAPLGALDHQTGILNAVNCYAAAGYEVDVLTVRNVKFPAPAFAAPNVRVRYMPWTFDSEREPRTLVTLLFSLWVLLVVWRSHPLIFAGGIRGLLAAYAYSLFRNARIVNYQTELYVGSKLDTPAARLFKALERRAAQRSDFSIEHDAERRDLMAADLGVAADSIVIVPNAPVGPAKLHRSTFLHRLLRLDEEMPLLLCAGTLSESFESSTVVRAAQTLPAGWRCVLHSAQPRKPDDPYLAELRALDRADRVTFSIEPVAYSQIDEVMGSARIGIALYSSSIGHNYAAVGLASGKLSHFLKIGVPVIVSPLPGLAKFVRDHGVGEVLEDPQQLGALVERIMEDEDGYRARALRCFDAYLSYEQAFRKVLERTERIRSAGVRAQR